jgi:hypothetical protein
MIFGKFVRNSVVGQWLHNNFGATYDLGTPVQSLGEQVLKPQRLLCLLQRLSPPD